MERGSAGVDDEGDAAVGPGPDTDPDIEDVLADLEELEDLVDSPAERERVRETIRTVRRVQPRGLVSGFRSAFGSRDAGEALVGSFLFGVPMLVEGGTLEVGSFVATSPLYLGLTVAFGLTLTLGILHAARFESVEADLLFGVVPVRLVSILGIACLLAVFLMTVWGRVDWATPWVAASQTAVTAIVMAVGAAIGDVLPE